MPSKAEATISKVSDYCYEAKSLDLILENLTER